jgi:hypothetical protein
VRGRRRAGDKATIWAASQAVWPLRSSTAQVLGLQPENVHVIFKQGPGCYGINGADTVAYDAALLSQAVGRPVRVQLMRGDEMAWENYGLAYVVEQRAAVDRSGAITAWDYESWAPGRGGRPGPNNPGNLVTGTLTGFEPAAFQPRTPAPAPTAFANNNNAVPSYVTGAVNGPRRRDGDDQVTACCDSWRPLDVFHRSAPLTRAIAEHLLPTSRSSTKSPRRCALIRSHIA